MKNLLLLLLTIFTISLFAETIQEVSVPTAGLLQKGEAKIYTKIYKENGMIVGASVGFFDGFMFGVSYGAEQIVGDQNPEWHDKVDFNAKLRILDESLNSPALVVGFDSQGHGKYYKDADRYDIKSKGFYSTVSKNFNLLGLFGIDGGLNYSLENQTDGKKLNMYAGCYKTIGKKITTFAEYDFAFNDKGDSELNGNGSGYFNVAGQLNINEQFSIKVMAHDVFKNRPNAQSFDRAIQINYRWKY
jgi:hypothetical protein